VDFTERPALRWPSRCRCQSFGASAGEDTTKAVAQRPATHVIRAVARPVSPVLCRPCALPNSAISRSSGGAARRRARLPRRALPWRGPPGARRAYSQHQHRSARLIRSSALGRAGRHHVIGDRARRSAWYLCECLTRFGSCLRVTVRSTRHDPLPRPLHRASSARAEPLPAQSIMPPLRGSVDSPATPRGVWQLSGEGTQPPRCCRVPGGRHDHREGGRDDPEGGQDSVRGEEAVSGRVAPSGAAASWRRHLGERYMGLVLFVRCGGG
jgi:hypothetical protein